MRFVAIFQKLGRKWKAISNYMEGRSTLQCRTHGQKYLLALKQFEEQIKSVIAGQAQADQAFCMAVHKYEAERRTLFTDAASIQLDAA